MTQVNIHRHRPVFNVVQGRRKNGEIVWTRGVIGVVLSVLGVVWILQGANVIHGSGMSGHSMYAVLGAIVLVIGVTAIGWAWRIREHHGI